MARLDEKLRLRNGRLITKLQAWGELLDAVGWGVALDWRGEILAQRESNRRSPTIRKTSRYVENAASGAGSPRAGDPLPEKRRRADLVGASDK